MGCIVWGNEYVGNFLRYNLRSMLSENNLRALGAQGRVVFSIVTDAAGERHIRQSPIFGELADIADVEFIIIPGCSRYGSCPVGISCVISTSFTECSMTFAPFSFAQGAASHLFMIPVDSIISGRLVEQHGELPPRRL